jgi:hypothetical protein
MLLNIQNSIEISQELNLDFSHDINELLTKGIILFDRF